MGCLNSVTPRILEVLMITFTVIGIGFLVWGIVDIPWDDISKGGKAFFYIGCILIILILIIILVLMCLRIGNKVNESMNGLGKCLCITLMVFNILALVIFIISEIIIFINMDEENERYYDNYDDYDERRRRRWRNKYSVEEWYASICSLSAGEIAAALNIVVINYLFKVIKVKANTSYNDYKDTQTKNNNTSIDATIINKDPNTTKSINVFNSPPTYNQNVLNFIGYDQNGHPIYSGSTQYFTPTNVDTKANGNNNVVKK